MNITLYTRKLK